MFKYSKEILNKERQRRASKNALFDGFARVAKALASGRRAEVVDVLAQAPRSVDEIATEIGQSVANTSHHLQVLAGAGLVRARRDGTRMIYSLASPEILELWKSIQRTAEDHIAELERLATDYVGDRGSLETITRSELARRLRAGGVTVVDVRPRAEYDAGHIPRAVWAAPDRVGRLSAELAQGSEVVVAYCRGPYCVYADDAVRALRRRGVNAVRLEDGFPEWRRAGLPIEGKEAG